MCVIRCPKILNQSLIELKAALCQHRRYANEDGKSGDITTTGVWAFNVVESPSNSTFFIPAPGRLVNVLPLHS